MLIAHRKVPHWYLSVVDLSFPFFMPEGFINLIIYFRVRVLTQQFFHVCAIAVSKCIDASSYQKQTTRFLSWPRTLNFALWTYEGKYFINIYFINKIRILNA